VPLLKKAIKKRKKLGITPADFLGKTSEERGREQRKKLITAVRDRWRGQGEEERGGDNLWICG